MKALKINLQDNISLLNNVLSGLHAEGITPRDDTLSAQSSAIGEQVRTLQELVIILRANQFDSIKDAVQEGIRFVLAKFKSHDPNLNLQPVVNDFAYPEPEAEQLIATMQPIAELVTEGMQISSPPPE